MNYITNQTDQVIAADDSLLTLLNVESIEELTRQIILGNILFTTLSKESISIETDTQTHTFTSQASLLSSMVGNLNLISLEKPMEDDTTVFTMDDKQVEATELKDADFVMDNELIFIKEDETPTTLISPEEPTPSYDNEISFFSDAEEIKEDTEHTPTVVVEDKHDDVLFDLIMPQVPEETIDEISMPQMEDVEEKDDTYSLDTTPIIINVNKISDSIGISQEDYTLFLNEYIDTAISLEKDLKSEEDEKRSSAIASLTQLSTVLQLPFVNDIMTEMSLKSPENQGNTLESFYAILARFITSHEPQIQEVSEVPVNEVHEEPVLEKIELIPEAEPTLNSKGFGSITLDDIKPIHFDFRMEEAANDLSLPAELIEEFVHDFIEQAHIETKKMLLAHEEGDLDVIQKIGHMLKGASSNLRINALSDTLYEIQFCEDSTKLEGFIKHYWGHFLSFEQQVNILTK